MELLLIRHAECRSNNDAPGGDPPLTALGQAQAEAVAEFLAGEEIAHLVAAPSLRAMQTADALAARLGLAVETDAGVAEFDRDFGFYLPGRRATGADDDPRKAAMYAGRWDELGSTLTPQSFADEVWGAIEALIARFPGQRVAVVTHGGVLNVYIGRVLGLPVWPLWFAPDNCSVTRVAASRAGHRQLLSLNDKCWSRSEAFAAARGRLEPVR